MRQFCSSPSDHNSRVWLLHSSSCVARRIHSILQLRRRDFLNLKCVRTPSREKLLQSVMQAWSDATTRTPRPQTRETWSGSVYSLQSAPNAAIIAGTSPGCLCRERVKLLVEHFCEVISWVFLWGDLRIHLDHIFTLSATTSIFIMADIMNTVIWAFSWRIYTVGVLYDCMYFVFF